MEPLTIDRVKKKQCYLHFIVHFFSGLNRFDNGAIILKLNTLKLKCS